MKTLKDLKISKEDAKKLIDLARNAIKSHLKGEELKVEEELKEKFSEKMGVFTTLYTYPEKFLRGCIGNPYPTNPIWENVVISSIEAAFEDPRFLPLKDEGELSKLIVEITILTEPELLKVPPEEYKKHIKIGKTGLMVRKGLWKGLLLPQVAVEYGFDEERFLSETCLKAGINPNDWKKKETEVYIFEGLKIKELSPMG
ncbi:MAG: TIGR00296 family protein, partial [candidate division WOR-3 bacterium]